MKKILTAAIVLALCLMIAVPVASANGTAVNSPFFTGITIGGIEMDFAALPGSGLDEEQLKQLPTCVEITTVEQAEEKSTDITQEERDALLQAYADLEAGKVTLAQGFVVRELVDISFKQEACRALESHGNKAEVLKQEGVTLSLKLDLGIGAEEKICVMTLIDGVWNEIVSAENNGDGTVTCVFDDLCPVAFLVAE